MSGEAQQDIDSGTGKVVTPGEPAKHTDIEDGQSVGHHAEPEHQEGSKGNGPRGDGSQPTREDTPSATPPPKVSRDDIYAKAKTGRAAEIEGDLADMTDAQRQHYDRMIAEAGGDVQDPFAQPEEPQLPPDQPQAAPNQPPAQGQQPGNQPNQGIDTPAETTTITVYGMQEQVPTADIEAAGGIAAYQKQRAADVRLERLATYEASLRNWERQLSTQAHDAQHGATPAQRGAGQPEPSTTDVPGDSVDVGELADSLTDAIYSGDREEAAAKLKDAFATVSREAVRAAQAAMPAQPNASPEAQRAQEQERAARAEANAVFAREFSDLDTPVLRQAVLNAVNDVSHDPVMIGRPLAEITREAAGRVREDVYGSRDAPPGYQPPPSQAAGAALHQQPVTPPKQDLAGRHALKRRTVVNPLTEASGRSPAPPSNEADFPSNSDWVAQLRKGRGQPA